MAQRRGNGWDQDYEVFFPEQVEGVLEECGVEVVSETDTHFLALCPFHGNTNSPAFEVDKSKGLWICFNPSCDEHGALEDLPRRLLKYNVFQSKRLILKYRQAQTVTVEERIQKALSERKEFPSMSQDKIAQLHDSLWNSPALEYMHGRGFDDDTLKYFEVGYSPARIYQPPYKSRPEMVVVPMHDIKGNPVGVIGRSIVDKQFKNSRKLPTSDTAWNIHRAKREGGTVIVCESSFDAMRIHQAGYPNVIALLGKSLSWSIVDQLEKHFSTIIIMTDFDKPQYEEKCRKCEYRCHGHRPGRDLGRSIAQKTRNKRILWAAYDDTCVFPHRAKDAGDMTDDEIRQCLRNAVTNFQYENWNIEAVA